MKTFRTFILFGVALALTGCGLKVRDKNEAIVSQIKKTAIVAFTVNQPASAKIGLNLNKGKIEAGEGGSMMTQSSDHAEQMYALLAQKLAKNLKWSVQDRAKMVANAGYQKAYDQTMKGWQNKFPPGSGQNRFAVEGIMDWDSPRILGPKGREQLIRDLGVDSIVVARVDVMLNGTSIMGIGSQHPQARLSFQVYTADQENAVWFDGAVDGEESKESVGATKFFDEEALKRLAVRSAETAFQKVGTVSKD